MAADDWGRLISEMDDLMKARDKVLDRLDYISSYDAADSHDKVAKLRHFIVVNYSKTKTVYKNYGFKAAVHAVYDYVMAETYYRWRKGDD